MIKNTNLYKFAHRPEVLTYGEEKGLSGHWWMDSEEWHRGFKNWEKENHDSQRVDG